MIRETIVDIAEAHR